MNNAAMPWQRERKYAPAEIERVRLDGTFTGYASLFSQRDLGNDMVMPGAFVRSLSERGAAGVRMLFQHNPDEPIGVWTSIAEDARGLHVVGRLTRGAERGREVHELMRAGAIDGLSIGFKTVRASAGKGGLRRILEADLWEISVVTFPMQPGARIDAVKTASALRPRPTAREFERWLVRDAGLTRSEARTVIAKGFARLGATRRDAVGATKPTTDALAARFFLAAERFRNSLQQRNMR
jgi:HK97 family phage prohead protease